MTAETSATSLNNKKSSSTTTGFEMQCKSDNKIMKINSMSCNHLEDYIASERNISTYCNLYSHFVKPATKRACVYKAVYCLCSVCNEHSPRLHVCLFCIFFGCYDTGHIQDHAKNEQHLLALDVHHGHVFCFECSDYVYSPTTFKLTEPLKKKWESALGINWVYRPWSPNWSDMECLAMCPQRRPFNENLTIGLRGLLNLGNTCFMNCIVQVLMHTPFLRNYFLSDRHECGLGENCPVCEISNLFQKFYSGLKSPLSPHSLLYLIWNQARHMAG